MRAATAVLTRLGFKATVGSNGIVLSASTAAIEALGCSVDP
jgi:hypothetical protein